MSTKANDPLVNHLEDLAARDDRATLAALRASLRDGHELEGLRVVLPYLDKTNDRRREDDALLVAALFALHPESGSTSLAAALRSVARQTESGSIELRFRALLAVGREDLPTHLRSAVTLAATKGIGVDWRDLHRSIRLWDHEDDFVRREWARDFWGADEHEATDQPSVPTQ